MPSDRLRVFVSSKMRELAAEREAIKEVLAELEVDAWVFEQDAGARPETIEETYKEQLVASDVYIGVFWKGYGDYTIDEYELARDSGTDCLIYQKQGDRVTGRDPRLEAFLASIGRVESGLTVQFFDTPEELRAMVKRDLARWQTRIVRRYRDSGPRPGSDPDLAVLRDKVRRAWIDGVLKRAVSGTGRLEVPTGDRPDLVSPPAGDGGRPKPVPADGTAASAFLLIAGPAGSGKTVAALELARDLLGRSARDDSAPLPVVFNLSAWSPESPTLAAWLLAELSRRYQVPATIGRPWLAERRLLPILDGLDEVLVEHRAALVEAINRFACEQAPPGLVVTSRLADYEALPVRLALRGAIVLQPLTAEQVDSHLEAAGEPLAGLRQALATDDPLRQLAPSPLMLSVMSHAYRGRPAAEVAAEADESAERRREHLFGAYVRRAFDLEPGAGPTSRLALTSWLSWLARRMSERGRTAFLIEDLQPSWLATRAQRAGYLLVLAAVVGLIYGGLCILYRDSPSARSSANAPAGQSCGEQDGWLATVFSSLGNSAGDLDICRPVARRTAAGEWLGWIFVCGLFIFLIGLTDEARAGPAGDEGAAGLAMVRRVGINAALFTALWIPLAMVMLCLTRDPRPEVMVTIPAGMVIAASAVAARGRLTLDIRTTESLGLERASVARGAVWGAVAGGVFALLGSSGVLGEWKPSWSLFWLLMVSALGAVLAGHRPRIVRGKTVPNEGIRLTFKTARRATLMAVPLAAFPFLAGLALFPDDFGRVAKWSVAALVFLAVNIAAWFGGLDLLKHYLLRGVIGVTRQGPWDFRRVLNEASRRHLLQRVGGGFMFVHRPLLEHFAALRLPPPEPEEIRDPEGERDQRSRTAVAAMAALAVVGVTLLFGGLAAGPAWRWVVVAGAIVLAAAGQWLVIRAAMLSALGEAWRGKDR